VKCDETKPACLKCRHSGRMCDGYATASHQNKVPNGPNSQPLATTSFYSLPFKIPGSQHDRQLLHYFCVHASADLAGYSSGAWDFWGQLVLEYSHHEPVVRSALIALASVHRNYATKEAPGDGFTDPLKEYNKAIRRLQKYINSSENPSKKVVLVCCALFYGFDSTRGEQEWALAHLRTALNLLKNISNVKGDADSKLDNDSLNKMDIMRRFFSQLDVQAAVFDDSRLPTMVLISPDERSGRANCIPLGFTRLSQAEIALYKLQNWAMNFFTSNAQHKYKMEGEMPFAVALERRELQKQFRRWEEALSVLLEHQEALYDKEKAQMLQNNTSILRVHSRCYSIALLTFCPLSSTERAKIDSDFEEILEEIDLVIQRQSSSMSSGLRSFSCHSNIIISLFFISCKCRDSRSRKRAIALLEATVGREGIWDAQMLVGLVRRMMQIEYDGKTFAVDSEGLAVEDWATGVFNDAKGGFHALAKALDVPLQKN
jgi:hypothetical protein